MNQYSKITALYSRLSVGDEDRDGGQSNSIQNQRIFLEHIKHYVDNDESGRFFDRPAYSAMIEDVRSGKIGTIITKLITTPVRLIRTAPPIIWPANRLGRRVTTMIHLPR